VLATDAEVLIFIHGMDSRAEEAEDLADALRKLARGKHMTVISMDLPTSGYATNLDHCSIGRANRAGQFCDALFELGDPKEPPQWFDAHGRHNVPVLDFIEEFIVQFVNKLDGQLGGRLKPRIKAVMGGSLGGNMSLRLGRRNDLPWVRNIVAWSPASIWESLADGAVISPQDAVTVGTRHGGVRAGWQDAGGNPIQLVETAGQRANFFNAAFDKSILGGVVSPAQAQMWMSDRWPCKQPALVGARLDRHETYDRNFRLWHWRLGTEQLIFSHAAVDPNTRRMLIALSTKNTFLLCGLDDNFPYTNICTATQIAAAQMTTTPGRALFLQNTGHSIDTEHPDFFARQVVQFLGL
jgi:pimeloyl-ACP methyl ester carboxylesterase